MRIELLTDLECPYCGGGFEVSRDSTRESGRLRYGLLRCRCFEFPVVDGILLLSLAKGYGGAEEALQPYVPLQAAAIHYLQRDDVPGLRRWIRRHIPLASELMADRPLSYLDFSKRQYGQLNGAVDRHLLEAARYEHLGYGNGMTGIAGRSVSRLRQIRQLLRQPWVRTDDVLRNYYAMRFFAPRVNALALQLENLPCGGRILSLCSGHGIFENLLRVQRRGARVVSVDGQFINLLIARRFAAGEDARADYICHDVQFPLPFRDGLFDAAFSSTCLPEIPAQRSFVREAARVTSDSGWVMFDSIWNLEMGVRRVNPRRHYRFCQNFFSSFDEYLDFFNECMPQRRIGLDVPDTPSAYRAANKWVFDGAAMRELLAARLDSQISVLALGHSFPGFVDADRRWLKASSLYVNPVFDCDRTQPKWRLRRRLDTHHFTRHFAPARFAGFPAQTELDPARFRDAQYVETLFCSGYVVPLPAAFAATAALHPEQPTPGYEEVYCAKVV